MSLVGGMLHWRGSTIITERAYKGLADRNGQTRNDGEFLRLQEVSSSCPFITLFGYHLDFPLELGMPDTGLFQAFERAARSRSNTRVLIDTTYPICNRLSNLSYYAQ